MQALGVTVVSAQSAATIGGAENQATATAVCPASAPYAISGGYGGSPYSPGEVVIVTEDAPVQSLSNGNATPGPDSAWEVTMDGSANNVVPGFFAYAVCAK